MKIVSIPICQFHNAIIIHFHFSVEQSSFLSSPFPVFSSQVSVSSFPLSVFNFPLSVFSCGFQFAVCPISVPVISSPLPASSLRFPVRRRAVEVSVTPKFWTELVGAISNGSHTLVVHRPVDVMHQTVKLAVAFHRSSGNPGR